MQKLQSCIATAVRYVKKKRQTVREVTIFSQPERSLLDPEVEVEENAHDTQSGPLVVRSISGKVVHSLERARDGMRVSDIKCSVCKSTDARTDEVHLLAGQSILEDTMILGQGQCIAHPGPGETLELSLAVVAGPAVTAHSLSGSRIEILDGLPERGEDCHFDRDYAFTSLGDFANKPGMRYIMTSNDDRKTPSNKVMWQLDLRETATVYINFRSQGHVDNGRALDWLKRDAWELQSRFKSTVSSGYPNGPYSGPVYAKTIHPQNRKHLVDLMGSNYWQGTYFVFIHMESAATHD